MKYGIRLSGDSFSSRASTTMSLPQTLGELKTAGYRNRQVKDEIRQNLIKALLGGDDHFTRKDDKGKVTSRIVGYEDTVIPQIINALMAKHILILLGLRGQAKSRILRELTSLLDDEIPIIAGSEINDDPF